jgi:citrate lyase subunit beta/citryl-CoA lyase
MRSLLFTPGDSDRKLVKGLTSGADVILIDLEDAVASDNKALAREKVADFLAQDETCKSSIPLYVRINDLETEWVREDLEKIVPAKPAGIMLPKARSVEDVEMLGSILGELEQKAGFDQGQTSILVLAPEIPQALLNIASFQTCGPRVTGIAWGSEDLATSLGAHSSLDDDGLYRAPMELARTLCLCAGSAAGIHAIDTVYPDFRDLEGLKRSAERAAGDGFSGKLAIHPDQVSVINAAFTPTNEEVARAKRIIAAFDAEPGAGVINLDGAMVDMPHLAHAQKVLERAGQT